MGFGSVPALWILRGSKFVFAAPDSFKSGLIHKNIVKHIVNLFSLCTLVTLCFSGEDKPWQSSQDTEYSIPQDRDNADRLPFDVYYA